jgi:hypothetical protein
MNETLSRLTTIQIVLIKVIIVTKRLKESKETHYNGRWTPTFAESSLSDELIYEQDGQYLRYTAERTTIAISLSEQPFFYKIVNNLWFAQPNLLFIRCSSACLSLNCLALAFSFLDLSLYLESVLRCR